MSFYEDMGRSKVTLGSLIVAAVLFAAVNIFSNSAFKSMRLDLTEDRLFTISQGTREVLGSIEEPINIRLYFSKGLGERSPVHSLYYARVRELLEQYRDISGGMVRVELNNPEPFTDAEDRAVAFGLKGVPINAAGEMGYFGLAATNSTDGQEVIAFFNREREQFIEYDLTKMIHTLSNPDRKTIGLISALPIDGGRGGNFGRSRPWAVSDQIRDFFEMRTLGHDIQAVPQDIDMLMIVHPKGLEEKALYAIDQYVLGGGKALVFIDPNVEWQMLQGAPMADPAPREFNRLLKAWGVKLVENKVAADLETARRVNAMAEGRPVVSDYVVWLGLREGNFNASDVVSAGIKRINVATPGILEKAQGAGTQMTPLITTGADAMMIDASKVSFNPDVVSLFRSFKPGGKPLTIAARIRGDAESAFADGAPTTAKESAADEGGENKDNDEDNPSRPHLSRSAAPINVIVVADTDMLSDRFWSRTGRILGQRILIPFANNADFVVNALDNLAGSDALIGLRGRGRTERPFHLVEKIRRAAETRFRAKEQELAARLKAVQGSLEKLQKKEGKAREMILTDQDKAAFETFRIQMLSIRKELRGVQHALRRDIESLDGWLKFINIAAVPIVLGLGMLTLVYARRRRAKIPVEA
ncbi:MAG: Gldg family protein [Rhodospirillales bacterium]